MTDLPTDCYIGGQWRGSSDGARLDYLEKKYVAVDW